MRRGGISRARVAHDLFKDSPNRVICTRRAAAALAHRAARIRRSAHLFSLLAGVSTSYRIFACEAGAAVADAGTANGVGDRSWSGGGQGRAGLGALRDEPAAVEGPLHNKLALLLALVRRNYIRKNSVTSRGRPDWNRRPLDSQSRSGVAGRGSVSLSGHLTRLDSRPA